MTGGPRVELVGGNIVVRESSLTLAPESSIEDYEEVEEGLQATAKYSSYGDKVHTLTWGIEETRQFYDALRQCGTDFTMMQAFFPTRTRRQLKFKFFRYQISYTALCLLHVFYVALLLYREELQHPELVTAALNYGLPLDIKPFEMHLGQFDELHEGFKSVSFVLS